MTQQQYQITLISHHLCPFVQRAVIALNEMGVDFTRKDIDLKNKPDWFLQLSPLGKVPVMVVNEQSVVFESGVIAEFSNDISGGQLLSADVLEKARQRAWVEFAAATFFAINKLYNVKTEQEFFDAKVALEKKWSQLEEQLPEHGFFCGEQFSLVDCAFAPAMRYFDVFEKMGDWQFIEPDSKVAAYREALKHRPSVKDAVAPDFSEAMVNYIVAKGSWMGLQYSS